MKIAVITAVFGGMDTPKPFCKQSVDCDRIFINEQNSPFPLPNLPPRLQAKYFKLQAHRAFPGYDCYVWIDGNIEVTSPDFVKMMTENLTGIRIQKHHERKTIKEEIDFILNSDNPYLLTRYGAQPLKDEYEYYLKCGMPEDTPLYSCNIFAWHYLRRNDFTMDAWHDLVLKLSWFDQSAFSFLHWRYAPEIETINFGPMLDNPFFKLHGHDRWNQ